MFLVPHVTFILPFIPNLNYYIFLTIFFMNVCKYLIYKFWVLLSFYTMFSMMYTFNVIVCTKPNGFAVHQHDI